MKRAFYEWGAITTLALALFCFGYWVALLCTPRADLEVFFPVGHWKSTQLVASDGTITINDHYGSQLEIETVRKSRVVYPPITSQTYWTLPGFSFQSINWGRAVKWSVRFSLLLPAILCTLAAIFFTRGYLQVRREAVRRFRARAMSASALERPTESSGASASQTSQ
jgi:hypothetical protein